MIVARHQMINAALLLRQRYLVAIIAIAAAAAIRCPCAVVVVAFSPSLKYYSTSHTTTTTPDNASSSPFSVRLHSEAFPSLSNDDDDDEAATLLPRPCDMTLNEIKAELKERNTSFIDCFDRESLEKRLSEAREDDADGVILSQVDEVVDDNDVKDTSTKDEPSLPVDASASADPVPTKTATPTETQSAEESFDRHSTLAQLRSLRVKELKIQLSELKVRWGTMIEKEELVQALCNALEERYHASRNFSRSGKLVPGLVADVDENILLQELGWLESDVNRGVISTTQVSSPSMQQRQTSPHAPILLDVYATWCGPCKFLAPILERVAEEVGPTVRVMKLDSDKYPRLSSVLKGECVS